jgi:hypothetical protein
MCFLKNTVKFLTNTTNLYIKFFFKLDLKLVFFFSDTLIGYVFYIFCIFYGFFGCQSENCKPTHLLAMLFALFMVGLMVQTYILLKIPYTRDYFENLVSKQYIEHYLGKYTGSEAFVKSIKYLGPMFAVGIVEKLTADMEANRCMTAAKIAEENFDKDNARMHKIPNEAEIAQMQKIRDEYQQRATRATGVISKSFSSVGHFFNDR